MSDDSHIAPGTEDSQEGVAAGSVRLAIASRSQEIADVLWNAIDERSRSRNRPTRVRAATSDADVIVYLPVEEDFADAAEAQSFEAQLALATAARKILFEPQAFIDSAARARLADLRDRLGAQADKVYWITAKPSEKDDSDVPISSGNVAQQQARRIERVLKRADAALESPDSAATAGRAKLQRRQRTRSSEREKSVAARRDARAAKAEQRKATGPEIARREPPPTETDERRIENQKPAIAEPANVPSAPPRKKQSSDAAAPQTQSAKPAKAEKKALLPAVSIAIGGMDEVSKSALLASLRTAFRESGARVVEARPQSKAHIAVHAFDTDPFESEEIRAQSLLEGRAYLRMFLGRATGEESGNSGADDRAITRMSLLCQGAFIDLDAQIRRHKTELSLPDSKPDVSGLDLTAALIVQEAINRNLRKLPLVRRPLVAAPDLADAYALAGRPLELLSTLSWSASSTPKLLQAAYSQTGVENFVNSRIVLSGDDVREFAGRIDWQMPLEERTASRLFGLGFLIAPLSYWYSKASESKGAQIAKIDAFLKQQNVTASAMLERAGEFIADFAERVPREAASPAWREDAVSIRIRALTLFLLCCKLAVKRRIKFDETRCGAAFRLLVDHIEFVRTELAYPPASVAGVERDGLLVGAGLALQPTSYGNVLLRESLERLKKLQLDVGLSADGVWRNAPFATHCAVLSLLTMLLGDLATADSDAIEPLAECARRMTLFVDALLKSNGEPLPVDAAKARSYASTLSGARSTLARIGARPAKGKPAKGMAANRITETYIFRDAQYFVSHSTPKITPESSQVAFHADAGSIGLKNPGGLKLAFAYGPTDLLLGTVSRRKELSGIKPFPFDPALRNGFRVGTANRAGEDSSAEGKASIVKSWRGAGWAAVKGVDRAQAQAKVTRIVVHLKARHALLVVDELASTTGEIAEFEQFWHVAPDLVPVESSGTSLSFATGDGAHLAVAFDDRPEMSASIDRDAFSSCVRRRVRLGAGVVVTVFHWTNASGPLIVSTVRDEPDDWVVAISGTGLAARVSLSANELRMDEDQPEQASV